MPFAFKRKESVAASVRRVARACLKKAVKASAGSEPEAIHNTRKEIKKLRALVRLVEKEISKEFSERINGSLREAAALLASARDAHVKAKAMEELARNGHPRNSNPRFARFRAVLHNEERAEAARFSRAGAQKTVQTILRAQGACFKGLKLKSRGWKAVGPGLERSYSQARDAGAKLKVTSRPDEFHEWRKRVKALWYHIQLLGHVCPEQMCALANDLEKLAEILGDDHDLHVLRTAAIKKSVDAELEGEATQAMTAIDTRSRPLPSAALKLSTRLFEEKPGEFTHRIHRYWKNWKRNRKQRN